MKIKEKLYLDTSVPSAYYDDRELERQEQTREFWEKLENDRTFISEITLSELGEVKDLEKRGNLIALVKEFQVFKVTSEAEELAEEYVKNGVIPEKFRDDALHLAVTTVQGMDVLVSWNFDHLVKRKTRLQANLINVTQGYKMIDIVAPVEL